MRLFVANINKSDTIFRIYVDDSSLQMLKKELIENLGEGEMKAAFKKAYKRAGVSVRLATSIAIREEYRFSRAASIRAATTLITSNNKLQLYMESPRLSVSDAFGFTPKKRLKKQRPITANIVKGFTSTMHKDAFIAGYKSKGVPGIYWRPKGAPRSAVRKYKTLSIPQMLTNRAADKAMERGLEILERNLRNELEFRLSRAAENVERLAAGKSWKDWNKDKKLAIRMLAVSGVFDKKR